MITHFGVVEFREGRYQRTAGTDNWSVEPIEGFAPPIRLPLGQVEIRFDAPMSAGYGVIVTPQRLANQPLLAANYGDMSENGFVVQLWETVADRTLQNASFSFAVLQTG